LINIVGKSIHSDITVVPQRYNFKIFGKGDIGPDVSTTSNNQGDVLTAILKENVRTTSADHYQVN
jgi:hypothetical protein